jgi:hypothetical protein
MGGRCRLVHQTMGDSRPNEGMLTRGECDEADVTEGQWPPNVSAADRAWSIVRAGLSAIPGVGGPAAELFGMAIQEPHARRRDAWLEDLWRDLVLLEARVDQFSAQSALAEDELVETVVRATQTALRTSAQEKLHALRAAVLNTALAPARDADEQYMRQLFLRCIEDLPARDLAWVIHLRDSYARHTMYLENYILSRPNAALRFVASAFSTKAQVQRLWTKELRRRGLIRADFASFWTLTPLGDKFVRFVTLPDALGDEGP